MAEAPSSETKVPRGPPVKFSAPVADLICSRMAEGETLRAICLDRSMPARATVYRWASKNPQFRDQYSRAREALVEYWADECVEIADDSSTDMVIKTGRNGHEYEAVDQEHIQRSRLRVDTRKWLMSKLNPGQYGDRIEATVSGQIDIVHSLSERERMRRMALFLLEDDAEAAGGTLIEGEAQATSSEPQPDDL